jgi:hypothetical protein
MLSGLQIVTADQMHKFLQVHFVAVSIRTVLLRHRAIVVTIGVVTIDANRFFLNRASFSGKFPRNRTRI